jgi:aspartate 1-decarboxylase
MTIEDYELGINKGSGAATQVTLPASPVRGQRVRVSDIKGDAGTNNITVIGAAAATISAQSSYIIQAAYASAEFRWNGAERSVSSARAARRPPS